VHDVLRKQKRGSSNLGVTEITSQVPRGPLSIHAPRIWRSSLQSFDGGAGGVHDAC